MRRILPILALVALTATLFTSPVLSRHASPSGHGGASCVVTPASAPAGSTFTAVCTGFPKNQPLSYDPITGLPRCNHFPPDTGAAISWDVGTETVSLWNSRSCSATDSRGGFTVTQVVPVSGPYASFDAQVRIGCCSNLTDAYVRFTVTP